MKLLLLAAALLAAGPAMADELRDFCPTRPGLDTPPCIADRGHVIVELGLGSWERSHDATSITHEFIGGDVLARLGVTDRLEVFAGWTAYGRDRVRDRLTGGVAHSHGTGDVALGLKQSLLSPGGDGTSVAVQAFVTAPTGTNGFGADGWTQGVLVPVSFDLGHDFALAFTPEVDRLPDTLRSGHHLAWQGVGGLSRKFGKVTAGAELLVNRDDDPGTRTTQVIADANLAWQPADNLQFDAEVDAGLSRDAPDVRVALGVSRRF